MGSRKGKLTGPHIPSESANEAFNILGITQAFIGIMELKLQRFALRTTAV
jgi:hypothetical protein